MNNDYSSRGSLSVINQVCGLSEHQPKLRRMHPFLQIRNLQLDELELASLRGAVQKVPFLFHLRAFYIVLDKGRSSFTTWYLLAKMLASYLQHKLPIIVCVDYLASHAAKIIVDTLVII
jgi:hypothetical protein